jgi:hypothetical protein
MNSFTYPNADDTPVASLMDVDREVAYSAVCSSLLKQNSERTNLKISVVRCDICSPLKSNKVSLHALDSDK